MSLYRSGTPNKTVLFLQALFVALLTTLAACSTQTPQRVIEVQGVAPVPDKSHYEERKQIIQAETHLDQPGLLFFVYFRADDGTVVDNLTCNGRPNSSTESLEPNMAYGSSYGSQASSYNAFPITIEGGQTVYTNEQMGIDGTFGEPVPYLFCMTPEGYYEQWSPYDRYRISSAPLSFENRRAKIDLEIEARKVRAEAVLRGGGCVDSELNQINCEVVDRNLGDAQRLNRGAPQPTATPTR